MGVASPLQSGKPIEYWLDGLTTSELVGLWEFLSGNRSEDNVLDRDVFEELCKPSAAQVKKHLYSESLPSNFYVRKDAGGLRPAEPRKGAMRVRLYEHRRTRDPLNK